MLHVLWMILKIIGIVLLVILGLLLSLVLLVLLVPIRYRIEGSFYGKPEGTVRVTWLLHILSAMVSYREDLQISVKVFGFPVFRDTGGEAEELVEEEADELFDGAKEGTIHAMEVAGDGDIHDPMPKEQEPAEFTETVEKPAAERNSDTAPADTSAPRLHRYLKAVTEKIKFLFKKLCDMIRFIGEKYGQLLEFVHDPANQATFKLITRQIKRLFRHLLPRKMEGTVTFGFDDPYTTGQVLSAVSILQVWWENRIQITPVFDEQVIEGELRIKGRIRIGTILVLGIRILLDKNFRLLVKRWQHRGGVSDGRE